MHERTAWCCWARILGWLASGPASNAPAVFHPEAAPIQRLPSHSSYKHPSTRPLHADLPLVLSASPSPHARPSTHINCTRAPPRISPYLCPFARACSPQTPSLATRAGLVTPVHRAHRHTRRHNGCFYFQNDEQDLRIQGDAPADAGARRCRQDQYVCPLARDRQLRVLIRFSQQSCTSSSSTKTLPRSLPSASTLRPSRTRTQSSTSGTSEARTRSGRCGDITSRVCWAATLFRVGKCECSFLHTDGLILLSRRHMQTKNAN